MADARSIVAVLLAAGQSRRFGSQKLAAQFRGMPLVHHAANLLANFPFEARIAIVGPETPSLAEFGFELHRLAPDGAPLSRSIAQGIGRAAEAGAQAVLIALGDMPNIPAAHIGALIGAFDGGRIATRAAGQIMPPAIFGQQHFSELTALDGDRGANRLLEGAPCVDVDLHYAIDVDQPGDLLA